MHADLDVAELAQHEDEIVVATIFIIAAFETFQAALHDLDLFVEGQVLGGEGDVGRVYFVDGVLELHQVLVLNLGQGDTSASSFPCAVGQEDVYMGPLGHEVVGLLLADAGDEDVAGDEELSHRAFGAVGIDVLLLLAGNVADAAEGVLDVFTA